MGIIDVNENDKKREESQTGVLVRTRVDKVNVVGMDDIGMVLDVFEVDLLHYRTRIIS